MLLLGMRLIESAQRKNQIQDQQQMKGFLAIHLIGRPNLTSILSSKLLTILHLFAVKKPV